MPTSYLYQLNEIVELIVLVAPQKILDVGVGFGKYGMLAREYLEFRDGREKYNDWQRQIDGIEIFPHYLTPLHAFIYNQMYVGDARTILPTLQTRYDLLLLVDVIEHFSPPDGYDLLQKCQHAARNVLVSTPVEYFPQQAAFENPAETHLSHWTATQFKAFQPIVFIPNAYSTLCLIGEDAPRLHQHLRTGKRELKRWFPFLFLFGQAYRKLFPRKMTP
ncbi:MAG: hypothetical protein Fur0022_25830 [Anaerolineales bacterium]